MRYLPLTATEKTEILRLCGVESFEELVSQVPEPLRLKKLLDFEPALSESELVEHLGALADRNEGAKMTCHLGQGVYDHTWPTAIDQITNRGEFLTAYTPYQPELSQGTLQAIFEFQSMIADLMGMEVANASLYDGATSIVEGVLMAARLKNLKGGVVLVSEGTYDRSIEVLKTYLDPLGIEVATWWADPKTLLSKHDPARLPSLDGKPVVGVVLQSPNKWGLVEDWAQLKGLADAFAARSIASVAHPHSMAIFQSPGEAGIDIVTGEAQPLGIPMGFGGPHLGLFCCRTADIRQMPGRLVGATEDIHGQQAFCITLSTREQHIRREKATSNICSNQNLMAMRTAMYLTLMGPGGMVAVADRSRSAAYKAREKLKERLAKKFPEIRVVEGELFNEVCLLVPQKHSLWFDQVQAAGRERGLLPGCRVEVPGASGYVGGFTVAFTEKHGMNELNRLVSTLCLESEEVSV